MKLEPKNHGGKRDGSGRKPDWLKNKCASLIERHKLLDYLARVANGKETEKVVVLFHDNGKKEHRIEKIPCTTKDRLHALGMLLERGFGKPTQPLEHDVTGTLEEILSKSWDETHG